MGAKLAGVFAFAAPEDAMTSGRNRGDRERTPTDPMTLGPVQDQCQRYSGSSLPIAGGVVALGHDDERGLVETHLHSSDPDGRLP